MLLETCEPPVGDRPGACVGGRVNEPAPSANAKRFDVAVAQSSFSDAALPASITAICIVTSATDSALPECELTVSRLVAHIAPFSSSPGRGVSGMPRATTVLAHDMPQSHAWSSRAEYFTARPRALSAG